MMQNGFTQAELDALTEKAKADIEKANEHAMNAEKPTLEDALSLAYV